MSRQVWATYSAKDHLQPRALAADIMLFDQLVFPVPETASFPYQEEAAGSNRGRVVWSRNPAEWARWEQRKWNPAAQSSLLQLLDRVVRKVPWDDQHQEAWRKEFSKAANNHLPDYAFVATRTVLTRDLPAYVSGVEAMGPAYHSLEETQKEVGVKKRTNEQMLPGSALSEVIGWEFLAPSDDRLTDEELLKETVDFVTGDSKFRLHRMNFWNWQQQYLKGGMTDQASVDAAVAEMQELLEELKDDTAKLKLRKTVRCAFRIAPPTLALAGLAFGPVGAVVGAAGGAFLSYAEVAAEEWFLKKPENNGPSPAAFILDIHRHFGWE
jgi:hypothetical protein